MKEEFIKECFLYFNRVIDSNCFLCDLKRIKLKGLLKNEIKKYNVFVKDIEELSSCSFRKRKKNEIYIDLLDSFGDNKEIVDSFMEVINNEIKEDYDEEKWIKITTYILKNELYNDILNKVSKYELLKLITNDLDLDLAPFISQDFFDEMVKAGINHDEKERLFRLAMIYEERNVKYDLIVDYYIKIKDGYYLAELISEVYKKLDIDIIINKINDKDLIADLKNRKDVIDYAMSKNQLEKLFKNI